VELEVSVGCHARLIEEALMMSVVSPQRCLMPGSPLSTQVPNSWAMTSGSC
jgi:hypothetical protein